MPQPPPIKKKLGEAAPPAKTSTTKLTTIQPAVPKIKTLGAEAESGICLKTTVLINGIDGIKQRPEMSIKTISDPNGTTTAAPAACNSAWAQITPQATRAAPPIRCKRPRTF